MTEKRYAIVRCQRKCSYYEVISKKCLLDLEDCSKECINIKGKFQYGDTKKKLIYKIAQASINYYENRPFSKVNFQDMARWIVKFLGVE